jgi:hypothetical protein
MSDFGFFFLIYTFSRETRPTRKRTRKSVPLFFVCLALGQNVIPSHGWLLLLVVVVVVVVVVLAVIA